MQTADKRSFDIPVTAPVSRQALRHGEDAFAMVNRHHEEVKAMYRAAQQQRSGAKGR